MTNLTALAARVEASDGPSRELDGWIHAHLTRGERCIIGNQPGRFPQKPIYGERLDVMKQLTDDPTGAADYIGAPKFTASVDSALSLVPEEWTAWELRSRAARTHFSADLSRLSECDAGEDWAYSCAATPALALCAAALRAIAASTERDTPRSSADPKESR